MSSSATSRFPLLNISSSTRRASALFSSADIGSTPSPGHTSCVAPTVTMAAKDEGVNTLAGSQQQILILLFWLNHAKVRSTTQRLGNTSKPRRGSNLCQSMCQPSLDHSSAQILATFSGVGFGVRCTTSTLTPNSLSTHSLPLPRYPASTH